MTAQEVLDYLRTRAGGDGRLRGLKLTPELVGLVKPETVDAAVRWLGGPRLNVVGSFRMATILKVSHMEAMACLCLLAVAQMEVQGVPVIDVIIVGREGARSVVGNTPLSAMSLSLDDKEVRAKLDLELLRRDDVQEALTGAAKYMIEHPTGAPEGVGSGPELSIEDMLLSALSAAVSETTTSGRGHRSPMGEGMVRITDADTKEKLDVDPAEVRFGIENISDSDGCIACTLPGGRTIRIRRCCAKALLTEWMAMEEHDSPAGPWMVDITDADTGTRRYVDPAEVALAEKPDKEGCFDCTLPDGTKLRIRSCCAKAVRVARRQKTGRVDFNAKTRVAIFFRDVEDPAVSRIIEYLADRMGTKGDIRVLPADITTEVDAPLYREQAQRFGTDSVPLVVIGIGEKAVAIEGFNPDAMEGALDGRPDVAGVLRPKSNGGSCWRCRSCQYIYDPAKGDGADAKPGTSFEELPDSWTCPDCGNGKSDFIRMAA